MSKKAITRKGLKSAIIIVYLSTNKCLSVSASFYFFFTLFFFFLMAFKNKTGYALIAYAPGAKCESKPIQRNVLSLCYIDRIAYSID